MLRFAFGERFVECHHRILSTSQALSCVESGPLEEAPRFSLVV